MLHVFNLRVKPSKQFRLYLLYWIHYNFELYFGSSDRLER